MDIRIFFAYNSITVDAVSNSHRTYEVRCPIHGFIPLNDWEWTVISQPAFQRLRRIRQLAWTDYVYPGAMHTRFEHSLGVMHTAARLYDAILDRSTDTLKSELAYNDDGLRRDRQLVRFAALLHDIGHSPFSHGSEELFPKQDNGALFAHEHYSAGIIRSVLKDAIEDHPLNANYDFKADDVAALLEGSAKAKQRIFWRDLIDSQMDADKMDYLLRDSYHIGVQYGRFDLERLVATIRAIPSPDGHPPQLGISVGGVHAAEALVLARYFMFTQVYFHKTRVAYDVHLRETMRELLPGHRFPSPVGSQLKKFLLWDDWKVLGLLAEGKGGEHGRRLASRSHYRRIFYTSEVSTQEELKLVVKVKRRLGNLLAAEEPASKSWYKTGRPDIPVVDTTDPRSVQPLSHHSTVVKNLGANNQVFLYAKPEDVDNAMNIVREVRKHASPS